MVVYDPIWPWAQGEHHAIKQQVPHTCSVEFECSINFRLLLALSITTRDLRDTNCKFQIVNLHVSDQTRAWDKDCLDTWQGQQLEQEQRKKSNLLHHHRNDSLQGNKSFHIHLLDIGYETIYVHVYLPANAKIMITKGKICRTAEQPSFNFLLVKNVAAGPQKQPIRNQIK